MSKKEVSSEEELMELINEAIEREAKIKKLFGRNFYIEYGFWSACYGEGKLKGFPVGYLNSRKQRVYDLLNLVKNKCQTSEDLLFWESLHDIDDWGKQ